MSEEVSDAAFPIILSPDRVKAIQLEETPAQSLAPVGGGLTWDAGL
jgi:hypothetical protein